MVDPMPKFDFDPVKIMSALPEQEPRQAPKLLLIGFFLLVLAALGASGYFYFWPRLQPPELILAKMLTAQGAVSSAHSTGHLRLALSREKLLLEGGASDSPKSPSASDSLVFNLEVGGDSVYAPAHRLAQSWSLSAYGLPANPIVPSRLRLQADLRLVDADLYLRLREAPVITLFDLEPWKEQWIKLSDQVDLKKLFTQSGLIEITARLPLETLEGVPTYHYSFVPSRAALKGLVIEALNLVSANTPLETGELETVLDNLQLPQGEIWIGRNDHLIYRLTLSGPINKTNSNSGFKYKGNYALDWSLAGYNSSLEINSPTTFVGLEQVLDSASVAPNP